METTAVQDYLKAIYKLGGQDRTVGTNEIAEALTVRPPSVTAMLKRLTAMGLAAHEPYQGVRLTPTGVRGAVEVIRHHRLLELYLARMVGVPLDQVHDEAERLEHVLSEDLESRLDEILGFPTEDPHGDPIPSRDLVMPHTAWTPLRDVREGRRCVVRRLSDREPAHIQHLSSAGLVPGSEITVLGVTDDQVRLRHGRTELSLNRALADDVYVEAV